MSENKIYDVVIIGGGPSGLTAAIYASRARLKTLVIEKFVLGGQVVNTFEIKNYPGFDNINGPDLIEKMRKQAELCGAEFCYDNVIDFTCNAGKKTIRTESSGIIECSSVILSMGASARKLGAKNEDKLKGRGVSYCAVCDGALFRDKTIAIVGGGDSALEDVAYLTSIAKKVYLIHRRNKFRGQQILQERVNKLISEHKIETMLESAIEEVLGDKLVTGIIVKNLKTNETTKVDVDGVFIEVGREPDTTSFDSAKKDEHGYIITNEDMETNIEGVFAAGDCRKKSLRQIVTACSDGAIAATKANLYIKSQRRNIK